MSDGELEARGRSPADAAGGEDDPTRVTRAADRSADRRPEDGSRADGSGRSARSGFRSQPIALRILLFVSLTAIAIGVVRCSIELTSTRPRVGSVGVARALVDLDEDGAFGQPDSVAVRAARLFAVALAGVSEADVALLSAGTADYDAIARLRVSSFDGRIRVAVGIKDGASGRALFETGGEGAPEMLRGLLGAAALRVAEELDIAKH